jgi:hypothetical protein
MPLLAGHRRPGSSELVIPMVHFLASLPDYWQRGDGLYKAIHKMFDAVAPPELFKSWSPNPVYLRALERAAAAAKEACGTKPHYVQGHYLAEFERL